MSLNRSYDRVPSFLGGMDAFNYPADLKPNQSQLLQNMIVMDNGRAVTRPGADQIDSTPGTFAPRVVPNGPVQGLVFLDSLSAGQNILMGQGGQLYKWNGATWSFPLAFTLTSTTAQFAAVQGVDKMLISDGVKHMQLWDGSNFADCGAPGNTNAPVGATILAYIAGMYVAAGPGMVAGNGSTIYPPDTLFFSNYLDGTSGHWNINQSFRVGNGDGESIVALTPVQSTASTYPIYNLAVLKENSVWIVNLQPGAYASFGAMFAALTANPQGDQIGTGVGCVGRNAWCLFQNDLMFMSQDGVQSLQRMEASASQYQLTAPLSTPIQPYIDRINWSMAFNIQAIKYRQLAIFFVPLDDSIVNNYALVWNGRINQWMIWTGWTPDSVCVTRLNKGIQLVVGNGDGTVNQWKDAQNLYGLDNTYLDNNAPIPWQINTRALVFGSLDFQKKLRAALVRFNSGHATVNFKAFLDLADDDDWSQMVSGGGAVLPVLLPFALASNKPTPVYRSLEGLPYCNEFYLQISGTGGWVDVRGLVASAYLKNLRDPNA